MYINVKMIPAETIPRMGMGGKKESEERDEFKYDIFDRL
jgi:hypothetical protein